MEAIQGVWFTILGFAVAGAVVSLLMKEYKLYTNLARRPSN